ncbi:nuclear transport factor 2 family protein [Saprospiraceae bacterium]|nr:nuclear transport factor 2 family protein [Saprospiraceae bacterium]
MKAIYFFTILLIFSCKATDNFSAQEDKVKLESAAIASVMSMQEKAWSDGDIDQFMEGYWKSEKLRFVGSRGATYGWEQTKINYKKGYPTREAMGKLSFEIMELEFFDNKNALMLGRYTLKREADEPTGLFTLAWKKIDGKWLITSDMTCG